MIYIYTSNFHQAYTFVDDNDWLLDEVKVFSPSTYGQEGLRYIPEQDEVYILPGTEQGLVDSVRRNASKTRFDLSRSYIKERQ